MTIRILFPRSSAEDEHKHECLSRRRIGTGRTFGCIASDVYLRCDDVARLHEPRVGIQSKGRRERRVPAPDVHVVQGRVDGTTGHRTRISGAPSDLL